MKEVSEGFLKKGDRKTKVLQILNPCSATLGDSSPPDRLERKANARLQRRGAVSMMFLLMDAIIDLLQKNALMPRDEMARLLNMTTAEVEAAIAKLEADGIILGYQPVLNREKWDAEKVTAVIEVKITPERDGGFDRIASRIARFPEVQSCYLVSGGYDLLILVEAPNLRVAAAFVAERLSTIDAVQSTATHFRLKTYKENGTFHTFEASSERLSITP